MLEQPQLFQNQVESPETLALELFEASLEELEVPSLYQRWIKTIESYLSISPDEDQVTVRAIAASTQYPWHPNY